MEALLSRASALLSSADGAVAAGARALRSPLVAASAPPAWLLLVLALPHAWYMWVLVHPRSTRRTAALLRVDAVEWFSAVALLLNAAQFAALGAFALTAGRAQFPLPAVLARLTMPWVALAALPLFGFGLVLKVAIFRAIGKKGVYYGAKFGHHVPWVTGFPFSVTAHPQYLGSSLCILAAGLALVRPATHPGHALVPAWWIALYVATGVAEEGLCHSRPEFGPLTGAEAALTDDQTRPVGSAEALRLALMAPVVVVRWAAVAAVAAGYVAASRWGVPAFVGGGGGGGWDRAAHARRWLASLAARAALFALGFSFAAVEALPKDGEEWAARRLRGGGGGASTPLVVANSASYIDGLVLTAHFGPLASAAAAAGPGAAASPLGAVFAAAKAPPAAILACPQPARCAGGCMLPFSASVGGFAAALKATAAAAAAAASPGAAVSLQPAGVAYSASNSFAAAWIAPHTASAARAAWHAARLTAAWGKAALLVLPPPVQVRPAEAAAGGGGDGGGDDDDAAQAAAEAAQEALAGAMAWPVVWAAAAADDGDAGGALRPAPAPAADGGDGDDAPARSTRARSAKAAGASPGRAPAPAPAAAAGRRSAAPPPPAAPGASPAGVAVVGAAAAAAGFRSPSPAAAGARRRAAAAAAAVTPAAAPSSEPALRRSSRVRHD